MVLVQRHIRGRDLLLSECVRKRGVDRERRYAQAARRIAVDHKLLTQPVIQVISRHILQRRQLLHRVHQLRRPFIQVLQVVRSQRVLILRRRHASADIQLLVGLQEELNARHSGGLGPQPVDNCLGGIANLLPLCIWLEGDKDVAGITAAATATTTAADKGHRILDTRVLSTRHWPASSAYLSTSRTIRPAARGPDHSIDLCPVAGKNPSE